MTTATASWTADSLEPTLIGARAFVEPPSGTSNEAGLMTGGGSTASESANENAAVSESQLLFIRSQTERLLRSRLTAVAGALLFGLAVYFLKSLFSDSLPYPLLRSGVLISTLAIMLVLLSRRDLSVRELRNLEWMLYLPIGSQIWLIQSAGLDLAAQTQDPALALISFQSATIGSVLMMLTYAMFMPNGWIRTSITLLPYTTIPLVVAVAARWNSPFLQQILSAELVTETGLILVITQVVAVLGGLTIASLRKEIHRSRQLGQYRLKKLLASGGMGQIYLGEHRLLRRPCAIKVIQPGQDGDPIVLEQFEKEVRSLARLSHWNTVEIFDYGHTDNGTFYYVMEYLPGLNLAQIVQKTGPMPASRLIHFMLQICEALEEAHNHDLVHRDLKPANLFASKRGGRYDVAKLLDFGLVHERPPRLTALDDPAERRDVVAGSPLYMSPEQASGRGRLDARSDIYSLGASIYFLLTGRPPFEGKNPVELMLAHTRIPVSPPSHLNPQIPKDLEAIVMKCLAKRPADRFASVRQLREAILCCSAAGEWGQEDAVLWWQTSHPSVDLADQAEDEPSGTCEPAGGTTRG